MLKYIAIVDTPVSSRSKKRRVSTDDDDDDGGPSKKGITGTSGKCGNLNTFLMLIFVQYWI